ncbi:uncharacterized protein B4U79_12594, partial [Dinothrombium tinctorium]
YKPLRGGSYIDLPLFIKIKKAVVNVKNKDDKCFAYALLSALYPAEDNVERPIKYKDYMDKVDFSCIDFPTPIWQIHKFEKTNKININIF